MLQVSAKMQVLLYGISDDGAVTAFVMQVLSRGICGADDTSAAPQAE